MKLSIIIPVYNNAAFVERCLKSINLVPDAEAIIVDDGSTDGTTDILCKYEDYLRPFPNFHIHFADHGGVSAARNYGIEHSSGEYIAFLDADDELTPGGIGTLLSLVSGMWHGAPMFQLNHYRCHGGTCRIEPCYFVRQGFYELDNLPPKWAPVWNKLYKREFLEEHGIRFPKGQQFDEDRQFNLECLKHLGGIACVEAAAMNKHFDNKESICHTFDHKKAVDAIAALVKQLDGTQSLEFERLVISCIKMHLNSRKFEEVFGGGL